MTRRGRMLVFGGGAVGLVALLAWGLAGLPELGSFDGVYSRTVSEIALPERHATNIVATTTFDLRGIDTLGEELILFTAAIGVLALLRLGRGEEEVAADPAEQAPTARSSTLAAIAAALAGPTLALALYVVLHGHLTPGGGFQGGVVLAGALLLVYLAGAHLQRRWITPLAAMELGKAIGAGGFALIGLGGIIFASAYLEDFLGLGTIGNLISAGTYPLLNLSVGLEVAGAVLVILGELLDQLLLGEDETR